MGGRGSGRSAGFGLLVDKCEDHLSIDLAWMKREGMLIQGNSGNIRWTRGGNLTGTIGYRVEATGLRLIYRTREGGGEWQDVNDVIPFAWTGTNFNGRRQWFVCPSCKRQCRVIYGGSRYRCRKCHGLKYESQFEDAAGRAASQRHRLRKRLGKVGSLQDPFPQKPKGMHRKTYDRLAARDHKLEVRWVAGMAAWLKLDTQGSSV